MPDMSEPDFNRLPEDQDVDDAARDALRQAEEFLRGQAEQAQGDQKSDAINIDARREPITYRLTYYGAPIGNTRQYPELIRAHWMDFVPGFVVFHHDEGTTAIASADIMMIEGGPRG